MNASKPNKPSDHITARQLLAFVNRLKFSVAKAKRRGANSINVVLWRADTPVFLGRFGYWRTKVQTERAIRELSEVEKYDTAIEMLAERRSTIGDDIDEMKDDLDTLLEQQRALNEVAKEISPDGEMEGGP